MMVCFFKYGFYYIDGFIVSEYFLFFNGYFLNGNYIGIFLDKIF